jgi:hypothetical protein
MPTKASFSSRCAVMLVALCWSVQPMHAQETNDSQPRPAIEGGVSGTAVTFPQGLNYIRGAAQNVFDISGEIMHEAARQDTVMVRGPNVLPNGVVIQPLGGVGGVVQMGNMPIHRDKLQRWLSEMQTNLDLARNYVDSLIIPPDKQAAASATYERLRSTMQLATEHFAILQALSNTKNLPNGKILKQADWLQRDMKNLNAERKALTAIVYGSSDSDAGSGNGAETTTVTKHTVTEENKTTNSGVGSSSSSSTSSSTNSTTTAP